MPTDHAGLAADPIDDLAERFELHGPAVPGEDALDAMASLLIALHHERRARDVARTERDSAA